MATGVERLNTISGFDSPFISFAAKASTGDGDAFMWTRPRSRVSMQVTFTGGAPTVKVYLQGTIDGTNWFTLATFDTGASNASGDIVTSSTHVVMGIRARLETLSGGTAPTVTAVVAGSVLS